MRNQSPDDSMASPGSASKIFGESHAAPPTTTKFVYVLTFLSAIGGFLFGYDTGVVSGAMVHIRPHFNLNHEWHELIVSATVGAAWLFSLVGGYFSDQLGRKPTILAASFVFAVGAVVMGIAMEKITLLIGRIIVGMGIGLASSTVPMYIAEVAPLDIRGRLVTINNCFITGGQFIAGVVCGAFSYDREIGWRYMLGLSGLPAVIQFFGFLGMPESPRWLVSRGRNDRALAILRNIRGRSSTADEELEAIKASCSETERERQERGPQPTILLILSTPAVRRALILGCSLQIFQQLAGINTVMYYSAAIIQMAGIKDDVTAIWLAAAVASVNFFCTFIGLYLVEKVGRRPLTLGSLIGVVMSLLVLAVGFQLAYIHSPGVDLKESTFPNNTHCSQFSTCAKCTTDRFCGFCFTDVDGQASNGTCLGTDLDHTQNSLFGQCTNSTDDSKITWAYDWCPTSYMWLVLFGLILYLFWFAPGMGAMPWTINSEIFPLWARGTCFSLSTSCNWVTNLAVSMTFLTLTEVLTKQGAFYLYASLASIGFVLFYLILPETKGRSLEEVEGLFARPWFCGRPEESEKMVQYVHIRGLNRSYRDSNDSGDEDS